MIPRDRKPVDELTEQELLLEYVWCESAVLADLDLIDLLAVESRRHALQRRLEHIDTLT